MRMPPTSTTRVGGRSGPSRPGRCCPAPRAPGRSALGPQNLRVADVPGVDDEFDAIQGLEGLGAQQAVGVGDDADQMFSHSSRGREGTRDATAAGKMLQPSLGISGAGLTPYYI